MRKKEEEEGEEGEKVSEEESARVATGIETYNSTLAGHGLRSVISLGWH